jgi:hypothetical protein
VVTKSTSKSKATNGGTSRSVPPKPANSSKWGWQPDRTRGEARPEGPTERGDDTRQPEQQPGPEADDRRSDKRPRRPSQSSPARLRGAPPPAAW